MYHRSFCSGLPVRLYIERAKQVILINIHVVPLPECGCEGERATSYGVERMRWRINRAALSANNSACRPGYRGLGGGCILVRNLTASFVSLSCGPHLRNGFLKAHAEELGA